MTEERGLDTIAVLRRYPVKSMLGEELTACDVDQRGLVGDRPGRVQVGDIASLA